MPSTLITKYGSGAPLASDLVRGELAVDTENGRLYTEDSLGAVVEIGLNPAANVTFGDNVKAIFGAGSDLQIYHDGSNSVIRDSGTGHLKILAGDFRLNNAADDAQFISAVNGAEVNLYHNGSAKLATTATGIDVTGTVTADGLTVDGTSAEVISVNSTANGSQINFDSATSSSDWSVGIANDATDDFLIYQAAAGAGDIKLYTDGKERVEVNNNGDISFYDDSGNAKFFWDASAESLGIGTSSPESGLHLFDGTNVGAPQNANRKATLTIEAGSEGSADIQMLNASYNHIFFGDAADANVGYFLYDHTNNSMQFATNTEERMRIDSSGNVNVTGEITSSDKITVSAPTPSFILSETDATDENTQLLNASGDFRIRTRSDDGLTNTDRFRLDHATGDISFYDTSANQAFFWDASAAKLGIGTDSPRVPIDVAGAGATTGGVTSHAVLSDTASFAINKGGLLSFEGKYNTAGNPAAWASIGGLKENATDGNYAGYLQFNTRANGSNQTEAMRIDSSGNLLVGKTVNDATTDGIQARGIGAISIARSSIAGDALLILNKKTNDGTIADFRKDGATVGNIGTKLSDQGTSDGELYIASGNTGLFFDDQLNYIRPANGSGALRDNTVDLGEPDSRFKDLYLSGRAYINDGIKLDSGDGIYFGQDGTAANKLDDYEEGTFTPTLYGATSAGTTTYATVTGNYTKVGNRCTINFVCSVTATTGTGSLRLGGLPFSSSGESTTAIMVNNLNWDGGTYLMAYVGDDSTFARVYYLGDDITWQQQQITNESQHFIFTLTYQTA